MKEYICLVGCELTNCSRMGKVIKGPVAVYAYHTGYNEVSMFLERNMRKVRGVDQVKMTRREFDDFRSSKEAPEKRLFLRALALFDCKPLPESPEGKNVIIKEVLIDGK